MAGSRSRIVLYTVAALISLAGLADATYLTVQSLTGETLVCGGSADCFRVLGSVYARIAGIPVATFGGCGLLRRVQLGHVRGFWLRACPQVFCSHCMGDVRGHAVVPVCASVYAARVLPLLFVFGGACLRTRGRGSPYPFFVALMGIEQE